MAFTAALDAWTCVESGRATGTKRSGAENENLHSVRPLPVPDFLEVAVLANGMLKRAGKFATHDDSFLPGRVLENLDGIPQEKYRADQ